MIFTEAMALTRRRVMLAGGAFGLGFAVAPGLTRADADAASSRAGPVTAMAFDQGSILAAAEGIWVSEDGGASFQPRSQGPAFKALALATHPDLSGAVFAATADQGLLRSLDAGRTWTAAGQGLPPNAPTVAVAIAAHDPQTVYVAVRGDGLWQSKDGGANWEFAMDRPLVNKAEADVQVLASVGSPSGMGGDWVYAGTAQGVSRVPDCFCRWTSLDSAGAMAVSADKAKPAPSDPSRRLPNLSVSSLAAVPSAPDLLFAGLPSGIWKTADIGATWALVSAAPASPVLAIDPRFSNHVVAADAGGAILSSRDGGATWAAARAL